MPKRPKKSAPKRHKKSTPARARKLTRPQNAGYSMAYWGNDTFADVFLDALKGFKDEAHAAGFADLPASDLSERLKGFPAETRPAKGPVAFAHLIPFLVKVIIFLKEPATVALIEMGCHQIFKVTFSKFGKMFKKDPAPGKAIQYPVLFKPSLCLEAEQVMVTAIMTINKPEDYKDAEKLVPLAFQKAVQFLSQNGKKGRYLTYRIADGQVNNIPTVSDEPVEA
jgi:hypothetical protein